ncbi:hypothetical protein [Endozoicomonas numazuensis]|uniref:Lipoprotein n=1 Tax=Endozoicomonas numazuensis TaxID=1137799 RepID=A0A081NHK2_9GAMM|nr:hypothetical protein [Endozoicomonas numazuensis]KEQ17925.1 hypothetical protein GZ78_09875 [Endozoicomonas numazuensis]
MQVSETTQAALAVFLSVSFSSWAMGESPEQDIQDMSDPLAVYTQLGVGYSDKGMNIKIGQMYDTGSESTMGMNVIELKGLAGDLIGWNGGGDKRQQSTRNNQPDAFRFRNFSADMTRGRGTQLDLSYDLRSEMGSASYSFIQALPKMGAVTLYPLAGMGVAFGNNVQDEQSGYTLPGVFAIAGMYGKLDITDRIWLNYNPMVVKPLSGADFYMNAGSETLHEAAVSYQLLPRLNLRYFANWSNKTAFQDGDHRIEVNYQI